jgi:hypothetical protein
VGFDNAADGVQILRSSAAVPTLAADFTGEAGCTGSLPACAGLGGSGLGAPAGTNVRFHDAKTLSFPSGSWVYVTAGSGTGPVRVYRIPE